MSQVGVCFTLLCIFIHHRKGEAELKPPKMSRLWGRKEGMSGANAPLAHPFQVPVTIPPLHLTLSHIPVSQQKIDK